MSYRFIFICDECGKDIDEKCPAITAFVDVGTGRILRDGVDIGQCCHLCADHRPLPRSPHQSIYEWQPNNCKHVSFYFSRPSSYWNWNTHGSGEAMGL